ncbi:MAG TPA: peptide-N4-asparagine amidase [Rhizomicrobium sp.]
MKFRAALLASIFSVSALSLGVAQFAVAAPLVKATMSLPPKVGSGNVAVIEPPVSHPNETPCVVNLYKKAQFGGSNVNFLYQPPANCPGPYSTIVLSVDVSLDAGIQYDRSGTIWVGGVPLWFGTTAEPTPSLGPHWHFERDVTDYTALLAGTNPGFVLIANYTNSQDTSIITSSAKLLFYPVPSGATPPVVPDVIVPLAADGGGTVALNAGTDTVAIDQTLPTNIASANLDVYLQGQSNDEFWYTCVPSDLSSELDSCGGGALREGEITVDGAPAGVAPVYPWIFTGGIDPYLWSPIPGVQTLDFKPFRVPLTPFAGVLSNGAIAHQIALSVYGANGYFSVAGALMLYLDHGGSQVTGGITQNTLAAAPKQKLVNTIASSGGVTSGDLDTIANHDFTIAGSVVTSAGSGTSTVTQKTHFANNQTFDISSSVYEQLIKQKTETAVTTTATSPSGTVTDTSTYSYPLDVDIDETQQGATYNLVSTITQGLKVNATSSDGTTKTVSKLTDGITATDTLKLNGQGQIIGHSSQSSSANYLTKGTGQRCYGHALAAANNVLTSDTKGCMGQSHH